MPFTKTIAVHLDPFGYGRSVMLGLARYARPGKPWVFRSTAGLELKHILALRPDGAVVRVADPATARRYSRLDCPVVNVSSMLARTPFPTVVPDNESAGSLVAEHLLEQGLSGYVFVSDRPAHFVERRFAGFTRKLAQSGAQCEWVRLRRMEREQPATWSARAGAVLLEMLRRQPRPVGVYCTNDWMATRLTEVCHEAGLDVPGEVAVVGNDNNVEWCEAGWPPVSSVDLGGEKVGQEAGRLLDQLLHGDAPADQRLVLPTPTLVVRASSERKVARAPEVAPALRFIASHLGGHLTADTVATHLSVGRKTLDRRFARHLNQSVADQIRLARIERAKELLATTDEPLSAISRRVGYARPAHLVVVFRQLTGMTPGAYREQFRAPGAAGGRDTAPATSNLKSDI